eukprot:766430-Hanusia_phi.AAC.2
MPLSPPFSAHPLPPPQSLLPPSSFLPQSPSSPGAADDGNHGIDQSVLPTPPLSDTTPCISIRLQLATAY